MEYKVNDKTGMAKRLYAKKRYNLVSMISIFGESTKFELPIKHRFIAELSPSLHAVRR